jgi:hypothetical protein
LCGRDGMDAGSIGDGKTAGAKAFIGMIFCP